MEQPRYWMWTNRRHGLSTYDDSWEEQAFAEDAAGPLGGCVWPPRSYSCSFCRREFRSAQALGGHMNVHRRDRARLKQSPNPQNDNNLQSQTPLPSLGSLQYPSHRKNHHKVCSFLNCNPNPNSAHQDQNRPEKDLLPTFSSQAAKVEEKLSNKSPCSSAKSCSNSSPDSKYYHFSDLRKEADHKKRPRIEETGLRVPADCPQTDLSVSLNLFVRRARPATPCGREEDQGNIVGCKRKRMENWALPLLLKPIAVDRSPTSIDHDLDLELRLGGTA